MINPYLELSDELLKLINEKCCSAFDYLPDNKQPYPFAYLGNQVNTDIYTKDRTLGSSNIVIDIYTEFDHKKDIYLISDNILSIANNIHTEHFFYSVQSSNLNIISDMTTDIPLWHGILNLEIEYL